jgi:hypothetical protein
VALWAVGLFHNEAVAGFDVLQHKRRVAQGAFIKGKGQGWLDLIGGFRAMWHLRSFLNDSSDQSNSLAKTSKV